MQFQGESFATRTKEVDYKHKNQAEDDEELVEKKKSKHKKNEQRE